MDSTNSASKFKCFTTFHFSIVFLYFIALDQDRKANWKCPECCNKARKTDNSNTPIRLPICIEADCEIAPDDTTPMQPDNITIRKRTSSHLNVSASSVADPVSGAKHGEFYENRLRCIIKEELEGAMTTIIKDLVTEQYKSMHEMLNSFRDSLSFINSQYEDLKCAMEKKNDIVKNLEKDNVNLQKTVNDLSVRLSQTEQQMRVNNIEINGVPEHSSENLVNIVTQLSQTVDCPIKDANIEHVTRIAKLDKNNNRPRAIVVKLQNRRQRDTILAAVYKFNKNKNQQDKLNSHHLGIGGVATAVFVAEHLTITNKQLHAAARKKAKELSFKFVWIRDGRIYVRKNETSPAKLIRNTDDLKHMA